ncbi:pappalysin-1-like [Antedon mediterranea]|uniref:pappalysin-1-like n=1 Tax=Antedon mediterranea TaxID=105859 RepID=UPI003AF595A4
MCVNGQWEDHQVICTPVDCGFPHVPYAVTSCPEGILYGSTCHFECNATAKMQGTDNRVTCLDDGGYSLPNAFCQQECASPTEPENSFQVPNQKITFTIGSYVIFKCKAGYHIKDNPKSRRIRLKCGDNFEWLGPSCVRRECTPPPPSFYNGVYSCSNGNYFHSECRIHCPGTIDSVATVKCLKKGWDKTWDAAFEGCRQNMDSHHCPEPENSNEVKFTCNLNTYTIGTNCTTACAVGHEAAIFDNGEPTYTWKSNSKHIICTDQRQWYPDPSAVSCVKVCQENFISDGFCDRINNRAYCNWDGGDCCLSTVTDNEVIPFPPNCKADCTCRDPNAVENQ